MAKAAMGLLYGAQHTYSAPVYERCVINGKYIDITFSNVCDGLTVNNNHELHGFTICGKDGIYLNAKSKILSKDTIRVWNDLLEEPIAAAYAYMNLPTVANLCSTYRNEPLFMVAPFRTERLENALHFTNQHWMTCDDEKVYHAVEMTPDWYDTWAGENACLAIDKTTKHSGAGSLKIQYTNREFSALPVIKAGKNSFRDVSCDYSPFKALTFFIKAEDGRAALKTVIFEVDNTIVFAPFSIEQSEEWQKITVALDKLYTLDGTAFSGKLVTSSIKFTFSSDQEQGTVYVDDFSFSV